LNLFFSFYTPLFFYSLKMAASRSPVAKDLPAGENLLRPGTRIFGKATSAVKNSCRSQLKLYGRIADLCTKMCRNVFCALRAVKKLDF
ncbi:MAG TPA: hypothetical protein VNB22_11810, partial [Pyrinomonadaceae bacterium]|nr:hypothetical protein [Pyrinomonadaceae bacterium]